MLLTISSESFEYSTFHLLTINKQEEFEDIKGVTRVRISKKDRQHNGQKIKGERTNNDLLNIHIKLTME